jgi:hypothetical protein
MAVVGGIIKIGLLSVHEYHATGGTVKITS